MANGKQAASKRMNMAERAQQQMDLHFPKTPEEWTWSRKRNDGYTTVPRTLPLVMQAIDVQSKGQPSGHTLFCLWARSPDHPLIVIENPATFASEAGFAGERAVDTWRRRMKKLQQLLFILAKPGPSGDFHYVLLLNPNLAMELMRTRGEVQDGLYGQFLARMADIGAFGEIDTFRKMIATSQQAKATENQGAVQQPAASETAAQQPPADQTAAPAATGTV